MLASNSDPNLNQKKGLEIEIYQEDKSLAPQNEPKSAQGKSVIGGSKISQLQVLRENLNRKIEGKRSTITQLKEELEQLAVAGAEKRNTVSVKKNTIMKPLEKTMGAKSSSSRQLVPAGGVGQQLSNKDKENQMKLAKSQSTKKMFNVNEDSDQTNAEKFTNDEISKQIKQMQDRLNMTLKQYNESVSSNRKMRDQINDLRRDKKVQLQTLQELIREQLDLENNVIWTREQIQEAFQNKKKIKDNLLKLKQKTEKNQDQFEKEYKQVQTILEDIDDQSKKPMFMQTQAKSQIGDQGTRMHLERVQEDDDIMGIDEDMAAKIAVEKVETAKIHVKKKFLKKEADENHQALKEREDLEQKFNEIQQETSTSNIDQLIELFQEMEEKNYSLFKRKDQLEEERKILDESIKRLSDETKVDRDADALNKEKLKHSLVEFDDSLKDAESKINEQEKMKEQMEEVVKKMGVTLFSLCEKLNCNLDAKDTEAQGTIKVTEQNILQQMSRVESRVNEIVHVQMNHKSALDTDEPQKEVREEAKINVLKMLDKMQTNPEEETRHMKPDEFKKSLCDKLIKKD